MKYPPLYYGPLSDDGTITDRLYVNVYVRSGRV
ncbi:hypothetical protein MANES_01G212550v8 [Manihot esculenta]|uniref:Uncharacterized protein n=1 Tax=Manihot esculenta TaxID=3983 RepID=A0ACB7IEE8_MANES|nr:hypothetical protein MANES_01G212550v8 [Manihot esculenta]